MMRDKILTVFALAWLYSSGGSGQTDITIPCDDKRVEDVVNVTLSAHNKILTEGAQLALYEILEATKAQNESAEVVFVRFTSRETDCPAGGDKVWHECDYLQQADKVRSYEVTYMIIYIFIAKQTLAFRNNHVGSLKSMGQQSIMSVMQFSEVLQCNSTVDVAPWRHEVPEVHVECQAVPKTQVKESSEESKESIGTTQSTPLNCPTKPWREFKPLVIIIAPPNTTESSQPDPTAADPGLNDQDLTS
uniref:Kininogen 1 n=1 Tax=Sinocyclocheilus grahami TaxID=75366 RepID=A0A672SSG0_SINGR